MISDLLNDVLGVCICDTFDKPTFVLVGRASFASIIQKKLLVLIALRVSHGVSPCQNYVVKQSQSILHNFPAEKQLFLGAGRRQ